MTNMNGKQAAENGLYKYSTGKPCSKGHTALRYTNSGACTLCVAGYVKKRTQLRNRVNNARLRGVTYIQREVHPDDAATVNEFIDALATARTLS